MKERKRVSEIKVERGREREKKQIKKREKKIAAASVEDKKTHNRHTSRTTGPLGVSGK